ncbi:cell division protein FtsA [Ornithobacterium rhinotracheale]|uniref:Cell division protein FtsA n=2 Tax=Ornithobacterium rhinotracheale TaxID=28251 RepID=I3ZYK4_ORNRL|nr:cell division protein FtsA [Ornithobacterium rhinotracheale]AFL96788.1 cell division protein FtsA [Ornithobacterium rhinotracheale DSM 15997]AIP99443.1 cell division protein FtsA [Ornithobacterium rhinotracheale ORT-UMN 88]KGB66478.1 cell division protein FtsA [Ornithobacterium rhinotracheale H06-030791]MBN3662446.1 cell division protein FtsA [Ornithobacterium rhinotracheale]MCK0194136.1 cell division protein FtsA [Ornithobacterium rhinotracheale]
MENNNQIAVGLDIGTTKIVAMVGRKNEFGKLEILGIGRAKSLGVHRGVVTNITNTVNSITEAVKKAEEDSGYKITEVTVGIAGQHIRSLQHSDYITRDNFEEVIDDDDINRLINQVHKLVMLPGEEIIHVLPQEFKVDSEGGITEPTGMYGSRLEATFHVVVGQVASIKNIARCVKSAGLILKGITLEPLASSLASLSEEEKEAGVALVDIGGGTTDIAVFKNNIIRHTAVIPFGGNVITEDIKTGCSIIEKHAEKLKVLFGSAMPEENKATEVVAIPGLRGGPAKEISLKNLSQIIHARVLEILDHVHSELRHYGCEEQRKKLIAGIVLTGGGAELKHIRQLAEYVTAMDCRIGYSNEHIASGQAQIISKPEYATAVGLVIEGLNKLEKSKIFEEEIFAPEEEIEIEEEPKQSEKVISNTAPIEEKKVNEKEEKNEKPKKQNKKRILGINNLLENWGDKFIKMINDTE